MACKALQSHYDRQQREATLLAGGLTALYQRAAAARISLRGTLAVI